ncbi:MAG: DUF6049 family protein [Lapillicoccus sp.]
MTHPGRRRARHLLLLVLILLVGGFAGPATTGYAAAPPSVATDGARGRPPLTLEAVTPPVAGPGVTVTLSGTVQAPGNAGLTAPTVRLVLGATPVLTRAAVSAWATSTSALTGSEVASVKLTAPVAAGASAPFTLTVPAGRLTLTRSFGVIPVAIQLRDTASGTNEVVHTFVGWQRTKQYESLRLGIVAPVTLPPDANLFATDATTRTSAWTSALAPGGRVDRVLDGTDVSGPAGPVPVTWAVDPALVAPAQGSGDPVAPLVAPLLTRLATGVGRHTLWALPSADPDLAATVVSAPNDPTVARLVGASAGLGSALGVPVTTGVAWPVDGSFAADREAGLKAAFATTGLTAVVGSVSALPAVSGYTGQAPRRTASGISLLAWDDELTRLATQTTAPSDGVVTGQRFLAETATLLGESPGVARSVLVALPRTADPDPAALKALLGAIAQTPWVQVVPTGDLLAQAATQDPVAGTSAGSWAGAGDPQVDAARLTRLDEQRRTMVEVATVLGPNGPAYRTQQGTMLDQLVSARWRQDPAQLAALDTRVSSTAAAATSGISVSEQTTNFLADEGTLQVTVVNALDIPIEGVRLVLVPTNPRLRIVDQPAPVTIGAGSRAVVGVKAEALAAGLVPVTATLTTGDGTPIGVPGIITVRANPPGYGFYIVGGAVIALILLLGIVRTIRRPRTRAAAGSPATDPATDPEPDPEPEPGGAVAAPSVGGERPVG